MSFYDDASWLLVPSGIEEDIVFAQKPISGLGDLNFQRASDATYTDSTGVVRRSPYNLVTYSEMFSDVAWTKSNSTISINTTNGPTGTLTADTFSADGTNTVHSVFQSATLLASRSYNISLFVKKGTNNFIQIGGGGVLFGAEVYANFDLNNGTVGNKGTQTTAQIENYGNGWYRCSITGTTIAAATNTGLFAQLVTSSTSARGESNTLSTNVFIWGAQLVEGSSALDYFPTTNRQDVPRIDFRNADGTLSSCGRLLLEPQRTNSIRNSSMVGAVAGTPGTLPTNYNEVLGGLTRSVVAVGTENGLPYVDLRFNGTATSTAVLIGIESPNAIAATVGQSWTESAYCKIISATSNANSYALLVYERSLVGTYLTEGSTVIVPTSNLQRFAFTRTTTSATIAFIQPYIRFNLTNGAAYDFTIRIAAPQMELGAYATTWVPTTTAAVTRLADAARTAAGATSLFASEWTAFVDFVLPARGTSGVSAGFIFRSVYGSTSSSNWPFYIRHSTTNSAIDFVWTVGSSIAKIETVTITYGTRLKIAATSDGTLYINGTLISASSSLTPTTPVELGFGRSGQSDFSAGESVLHNQDALFTTRLTNAQLAQLTTL